MDCFLLLLRALHPLSQRFAAFLHWVPETTVREFKKDSHVVCLQFCLNSLLPFQLFLSGTQFLCSGAPPTSRYIHPLLNLSAT